MGGKGGKGKEEEVEMGKDSEGVEVKGGVANKKNENENSPFPLGATFNPTQSKWNHSFAHPSASHATISP